jgi:magnesium chelatase family protein
LHIEVPAVTAADLILPPPAEGSREVAARVARARAMQEERYAAIGLPQVRTNAAAHGPLLEEVARPDAGGLALLRDAADAMRLSARGYHRVLRVARTLADLDGAEKVGRVHFAEALSYRALVDEVRRAARERELRLQPSQRHFLDEMALDLLQDQVGALARRQNVLAQIEEIDARPDRGRGLDRLRVRQRRIAVKI